MLWLCFVLVFLTGVGCSQSPLGRWQAVGMSETGQYMTAALYEGGLYTSSDYGINWIQSLFIDSRWFSIAVSSSGQYQMVTSTSTSQCAVTFDYGQTWTVSYSCTGGLTTYGYGFHAAMDSTGRYRAVAMLTDQSAADHIFKSSNYGTTWARYNPSSVSNFFPYGVAISGNGRYQLITNYYGSIYYSSNFGSSFSASVNGGGSREWTSVTISQNGSIAVATSFDSGIYRSTDFGVTWANVLTGHYIHAVCEKTGQYWFATDTYFLMYSSDYAATWTKIVSIASTADFIYQGLAMSSDNLGMTVAVAGYGKCVFLSYNRGASWSECVDTRAPTISPTLAVQGPSAEPTYAPSGPTLSPTASSPASRPTFRPSTLSPTANATDPGGKGTLDKVVGNIPTSFSLTSLNSTNQIAVAVVLVLVVCCCCVPAGYFLYRRNSKDKFTKKGKKKGLVSDEDDGDVETMIIGKNQTGGRGDSVKGAFAGARKPGAKSKDPTAAMAARKKKKKNAPPPPPRHKKKQRQHDDDDEGEGEEGNNDGGDGEIGESEGNELLHTNHDEDEDTADAAQSPLRPQQEKSGKLIQKKLSHHQIPRPAGPPEDMESRLSKKLSSKSSAGNGQGFFSGFTSSKKKSSTASSKYYATDTHGGGEGDEEGEALVSSTEKEENV